VLCLASLLRTAWAQPPLPTESTAYWLPYTPGSNTIALYQFDAPDPVQDVCGKASALELPAGVTIADVGKFGGGLAFAAGHQPVKITLGESLFKQQRFIIEFWCKLNALPAAGQRATLLYKPQVPNKTNGLQCYVNADGSLVWMHRTLSSNPKSHPDWQVEMKSAAGVIRAGRWHHVAVYVGAFSYVFGSDVCYLAVDGVRLQQQANGWRYLDYTAKEQPGNELLLGGGDAQDAFIGTIDQFRIVTGLFRDFYPAPDESFVDPKNTRTLPANPACVATGDDILFKLGFDDTVTPEIARGSAKPVRLLGKPEFFPGVKGQAMKSLNGWLPLAYAVKDNMNLSMGAMEVWIKPLGWQLLDRRRPYLLRTEGNGPSAYIPNDGYTIQVSGGMENMGVDFRPNTWMHIVMVWAERQMALYVNGEKRLSGMMPTPFGSADKYPFFVLPFGADLLMDEFTLYRRPLSDQEVSNHYRRYFPGTKLTALPPIDATTTFFQGVGKVLGVAYTRQPLTAVPTTAKISLLQGGKSLADMRVPYESRSGACFLATGLPVPLPPGDVKLRVDLVKEDATPALSAVVPFPVKRYAWLGNTIGISDRVLKPWTPMTDKGGVVETIGRQHTLGRNGLFAQVVNHNQDMLAAPMGLEATVNGAVLPLTRGTLDIKSRKPNKVEWRSSAVEKIGQGSLKVENNANMEYDGHTVFTLTLSPEKGPVTLDRLSLVIPLKGDYIKLYNMIFGIGLPVGVGALPNHGVISEKPGTLFSSKIWYDYVGKDGQLQQTGIFDFRQAVPVEQRTDIKLQKRWKPTVGSFIPQFWLGNDDIGFSYMADSDAGWVPSDDAAAMTLERVGNTVEWRFNFITAPFTIT
ncbi:MAG TPA: glycoside hydrolase domain-containing protein, partial [Armatimonadota bacterium]